MTDDVIRLVLPADPAYGRIARITASNLALRLGFGHAEVEDLRIAVDELVILLLRPDGDIGNVTVEYDVTPDELAIVATVGARGTRAVDPAAIERFEQIVGPIVDRIELDADGTRVRIEKALPAEVAR